VVAQLSEAWLDQAECRAQRSQRNFVELHAVFEGMVQKHPSPECSFQPGLLEHNDTML